MTSVVVVCLIEFLSSLNETQKAVLQALGVLWGTFFSCIAFSLSRLLELKKEIEDRLSGNQSLNRTNDDNNNNHQEDTDT
jgi:hypothetical protein